MSNDVQCGEDVWEPPSFFHHHKCRNRAKWKVRFSFTSGFVVDKELYVCGVHVKGYEDRRDVLDIRLLEAA